MTRDVPLVTALGAKIERLEAEIEWLRAVAFAIDEKEPEKPSSWRYRREALCEMAKAALEAKP